MARVNLESSLFSHVRFGALKRKCGGDEDRALGKLCRFWMAAQDRWGEAGRQLVPDDDFQLGDWQELADTGWAIKKETGWYARGAEDRFKWYADVCDKARKSVKKREQDRQDRANQNEKNPQQDQTGDEPVVTTGSQPVDDGFPPPTPVPTLTPSPSSSRSLVPADQAARAEATVAASRQQREKKLKFTVEDRQAAEWLQAQVMRVNPSAVAAKKANLDAWANTIRMIREIDGVTTDDLTYVLHWLFDEYDAEGRVRASSDVTFWQAQVQSAEGLRNKWDSVTAKCWREKRMSSSKGFR